jgi:hypothetical protein
MPQTSIDTGGEPGKTQQYGEELVCSEPRVAASRFCRAAAPGKLGCRETTAGWSWRKRGGELLHTRV